ncbi:MAG: hypothetical protein A2268_13295 [Candidatus Raymondbacteria bacterium RifOxyA12_full_50_37]|uniref:Uncharacterized protein n=1 Tax=Candidatus Raymondbacteria bacterium RIFOXYD12_FULL_49_13 TaxID=1817890 RepID=A0A1F7EZY0_UNCRA|nr:MAG: hypothetical protein A2268_13295 [Candidatus Raymondbacteria bacterium RifOxyA12_full_50_37]OGJ93037.1 MAG: hypothetical protein A2248_18430 [Candidatus Raymondbacteria bacterium RIFOXYA2_FULL_49_16]OGJ94870.1 MAG: hypothetical protein A2350_15485 [Candidatus Raymondbacteria bacterium RifOxyB12_full_50_8]OGJ99950.1 MAG: hypothetical protein A2519_00410 [Candidatus Raymondbacteria bacterium RIFOXYD12_FULL_49_13]OGK04141.1 MAG: hypothetical protein A2487_14090 [Candidatus Raymondbacteria 
MVKNRLIEADIPWVIVLEYCVRTAANGIIPYAEIPRYLIKYGVNHIPDKIVATIEMLFALIFFRNCLLNPTVILLI